MKTERFAHNMKDIREFLGITQADLAKRAGLTAPAICQIESGEREPSLKTIVKILNALGCTFERIMK